MIVEGMGFKSYKLGLSVHVRVDRCSFKGVITGDPRIIRGLGPAAVRCCGCHPALSLRMSAQLWAAECCWWPRRLRRKVPMDFSQLTRGGSRGSLKVLGYRN